LNATLGVKSELVEGDRGEFHRQLADKVVAKKGLIFFPPIKMSSTPSARRWPGPTRGGS